MLSPESYIAELKDAPYERLVRERRSIIAELERQEKGFKDPQPTAWECLDPGPDVEYKMDLEYLYALTGLMLKRAGEITGMGPEEDELDEEDAEGDEPNALVSAAIGDILKKALPAHLVPPCPGFSQSSDPMLDAEEYAVSCQVPIGGLQFNLDFTLVSYGRDFSTTINGERYYAPGDHEPHVEELSLSCQGLDPKGKPFASVWDPETAEWSHPLPLS